MDYSKANISGHHIISYASLSSTDRPNLPLTGGTRAMKTFIYFIELGTFAYPILIFLLLRFLPCTPPFLLSIVATCESSGGAEMPLSYVKTLAVQIFETWMFYHITYSGTTWVLYVLFVGIAFLLHYFQLLKRWLKLKR